MPLPLHSTHTPASISLTTLRSPTPALLLCSLPRVRRAIKGVRRQQDLEGELPHCAIGALLALWVTQVGRGSS
jgi:hypothetical protein